MKDVELEQALHDSWWTVRRSKLLKSFVAGEGGAQLDSAQPDGNHDAAQTAKTTKAYTSAVQ